MARLYWRVKKNGKWTRVRATNENTYFYENDDLDEFHYEPDPQVEEK